MVSIIIFFRRLAPQIVVVVLVVMVMMMMMMMMVMMMMVMVMMMMRMMVMMMVCLCVCWPVKVMHLWMFHPIRQNTCLSKHTFTQTAQETDQRQIE